MKLTLSRGLAVIKDLLLTSVFGTFAVKNAHPENPNYIGEHTLPVEFEALGTAAKLSIFDALNQAIDAGRKGDWLAMSKNYLAAAAGLTEGLACDVAATHGALAKTFAGVNDAIAKQVAPDGFKVTFGIAAAANLLDTINAAYMKSDKVGAILSATQMGINITQCVAGVRETVEAGSESWGVASTVLSGISTLIRLVGFWRADAAALSKTAQSSAINDVETPKDTTPLVSAASK